MSALPDAISEKNKRGDRHIIIFLTEFRSVELTQSEKHKRPIPSSIYRGKAMYEEMLFLDSTCIGLCLTVPSKYVPPEQCRD